MRGLPTVRELVRALRAAGCEPLGIRGSHQKWRAPSGKTFVLTVNHRAATVAPVILRRVRAVLGEGFSA